jgi:uncharacterized membrane protein YhaH (DUF805 family)
VNQLADFPRRAEWIRLRTRLRQLSGVDAKPDVAHVQWIGNFIAGVLIAPHFNAHDLAILIILTAFALRRFGDPVPCWLSLLVILVGIYPLVALTFGNQLPALVPVVLSVILFLCVKAVRRAAAYADDQPQGSKV